MAGIHEKATKWLQENRKQLKHMMDNQRKNMHPKSSQEKKNEVYNCSYCHKVFFEAEYLVKHIFRRHSEKLLLLHKHVLDSTNSENSFPSDLIKYIKTEFSDVKGELKAVKQVVSEFASKNSSLQDQNPNATVNTDVANDAESVDSVPDCTAHTECSPTYTSKPAVDVKPADLDSRMHDLLEKYKKDVILNEVKSITATNKKEVSEELKNYLHSELQSMLQFHLDKNNSEWKMHVSKLQKDVARLADLVASNSKMINSPEALQILEKKFEQQLQIFLNTSSSIEKRNLTNQKPTRGRKKKGLYTLNSQATNTTSETTALNLQSDTSQCEKTQKKKQKKANHSKINLEKSSPEKEKRKNPFFSNEVNYVVDDKLRSLNIDPLGQKILSEDYEKKIRLVKTENAIRNSSAVHFSDMRNKLESYVDDLAKSRLKAKCPKKLRFSDSLVLHSTLREEKSSELSMQLTRVEKEAPRSPAGHTVDCYARGDCSAFMGNDLETVNAISVQNFTSEHLKNELGQKCDSSSMKISAAEISNKSLESVRDVHFSNDSRSMLASSNDLEELSELSSLSDLED